VRAVELEARAEAERAREERLARLRAQVQVNVKDDPTRHLNPTVATQSEHDVSKTAQMFPVHGFTTDHLMKDRRFKVQLMMNEAGIKNPELRAIALTNTAPYRPRPEMASTHKLV